LPSLQLIVHTISVGKDFCSLVSCLGEVYTWGYNQFGQLGHDDRIMRPEPAAIKFFKDTVIIDISCGNQHCLALDCDGTSYVWGRNQAVIGQTEILDRYGKINNYQNVGVHQFKPRVMKEVLGYYKIKKISSGGFHNAVLTEKSELYLWGDNESNQLGLKDLEALNITIPKQIEFFQINKYHIHEVSCGGLHTLALVEDSNGLINVWSWGDDTQGQCGSGKKKVVQYPEPVKEFEGKIIDKISAGSFHSLVLVKAEGLYGFGYNGNGEFGMKTQKKKIRKPMKIEGVPEGKILDVSAGFEISCLTFV
jgi:alpha-tubulin suppressor-like RCC1 family protein